MRKFVLLAAALVSAGLIAAGGVHAANNGMHMMGNGSMGMMNHNHMAKQEGQPITITGEVLDMACYLDHGAHGANHAACAAKCIRSGLPVGIKAKNGNVYLLIGEHKPINKELSPLAAKTITVQGKLVMRNGFRMIENARIVKK